MSSVCSSYESRLADFDRQIATSTAKIAALENERQASAKAIDKIRPRLSYRRFARRVRLPAQSYSLWQPGLYLVAPAFTAVICYITFDLLSSSGAFIFGSTLFGVLLSVAVMAMLLNYPPDSLLPTQIAEMEAKQRALEERANAASGQLVTTRQRLEAVTNERSKLLQSIEWRRAALLQRDWKSFRDDAWEAYLAEVFTALGGAVQHTGKAGDQGVDLVVQFSNRCIAVQAKGYYHAVSNHAVQEVVAGMAYYNCNSSAVVTNSRFTRGAIELAERNKCVLIGEDEFPDLVMGRVCI